MKLWFGKKGMDEGAGACEVLTITDRESGTGETHSTPVLFAQAPSGAAVGAGVAARPLTTGMGSAAAEAKKPAAGGMVAMTAKPGAGGGARQPEAASGELPKGPVMPAQAGKGAAVSVQAPVNRLQGGTGLGSAADVKSPRPVMTPVRMAPATAPIKLAPVTSAPVAAAPVAAAPAPAAGGAAPRPAAGGAFGFRPKDGAAPAAAPVTIGPKPPVTLGGAGAPAAPKPAMPLGGATGAATAPKPQPLAAGAAAGADKSGGPVERDLDGVVRPKTDQRALYYQLMNGLYDAVLILDDQGHIVDCNSRVTVMLGYSREDTWDIPIEKIITGMTSQMFEHLKRNLAENNHILIDARCFRQDGTSFAGEVGVSTLSLTRGSNIVFAIRNVDRRKHAMDEMRKGQSALEVALAPAFVCDLDGFFLIVNQAMLDAFGIPDEAQAKNVRFIDLLPDAARFFLRASCGEKLRESLRIPTPNGVPVKVELALKPVQSGQTVTAVAGSILQA